MTKDEKKLIEWLTAKVPSEMLSEALALIYLNDDYDDDDVELCGQDLIKACKITGPIMINNEGHLVFGDYITEATFESSAEVKRFVAITAAEHIDCVDIV